MIDPRSSCTQALTDLAGSKFFRSDVQFLSGALRVDAEMSSNESDKAPVGNPGSATAGKSHFWPGLTV